MMDHCDNCDEFKIIETVLCYECSPRPTAGEEAQPGPPWSAVACHYVASRARETLDNAKWWHWNFSTEQRKAKVLIELA